MKKFKLIALFFVFFSLFLVSCKSSKGCGCLEGNNNHQTENPSSKA